MQRRLVARGPDGGFSLVEMLVVLGIIMAMAAVSIPHLKAYAVEARLLGASRVFKGGFRKAHSIAIMRRVYTAIRFEESDAGPVFSVYLDGNRNGVRSADIEDGVDVRIEGPLPLDGGAAGVRVGIHPGIRAIPPDTGVLDPNDPIRFGRSNMLSFSPLGTASPGTFYLAGEVGQAAVRVSPGSGRVRVMVWKGRWVERS